MMLIYYCKNRVNFKIKSNRYQRKKKQKWRTWNRSKEKRRV